MPITYKYGKVIELPSNLNPNKLIYNRIREEYSKCPFCGEGAFRIFPKSEFRLLNGESWQFWKKRNYCNKLEFTCNCCGAKWESPWFPQDIKIDEIEGGVNIDVEYFIKKYEIKKEENEDERTD